MNENTTGYELDWDSEIENDAPDYPILPEGDYNFEVISFERGRHGGSEKLPPCAKATLSIKVSGPEGETYVRHNLFLHSSVEWRLCEFFTAIGQRKHGEKVHMNWNAVPGSKGRCKLKIRKYTNKNGDESTINEIKKFYEAASPAPAAPAYTGTYSPGKF